MKTTFDEALNDRIRERLSHFDNVVEKRMFGGSCFMLNDKMCVGVIKNDMMCRIGPHAYQTALTKTGCREMDFTSKPMIGYVYVSEEGLRTPADFDYWIQLCVDFNAEAKSSKSKKKS